MEILAKDFYEESIIIRHLIKTTDIEEFTNLIIKNYNQMRRNKEMVQKFEKNLMDLRIKDIKI